MVLQILITYYYKTFVLYIKHLFDLLKKPLIFYHVWVIVWYSLNSIQLSKGITTVTNGNNSEINKWIHGFTHSDYKATIDIKTMNNSF